MAMLSNLVSLMILRTQGTSPRAHSSVSKVINRVRNINADLIEETPLPIHIKTDIVQTMNELISINRSRSTKIPVSASIKIYDENWNLIDQSVGFNHYTPYVIHAEIDALEKLKTRKGYYGIIIVARKTTVGLSRPCINCLYSLITKLNTNHMYIVYHINENILVEKIK